MHFHHSAIPIMQPDVILLGYFQSYKYFDAHKNTIFEMIQLKQLQNSIRSSYKHIPFDKSVCMHFRRGDYKDLQHCHPLLKLDYYEKALRKLIEDTSIENWNVLYFCEIYDMSDIEPMIRQLRLEFPSLNFQYMSEPCDDWQEMLMMSLCQHHIIANSTFSYFGAYFQNDNYTQRVYYPNTWFGPHFSYHDTKDLCPPSWTKIL